MADAPNNENIESIVDGEEVLSTSQPVTEIPQPEALDQSGEPDVDFSRSDDLHQAFEQAVTSILEQYPLEEIISGTSQFFGLDLDTNIELQSGNNTSISLIHLQVEPLLDQAADLLDRALNSRRLFDETTEKMFNLLLELNEYIELDRIHRREEQEGLYDTPYERAYSEYAAEHYNKETNELHANNTDLVSNFIFTGSNWSDLVKFAVNGAYISGVPPYIMEEQVVTDYPAYDIRGENKVSANHAESAAFYQLFHSKRFQVNMLNLQSTLFKSLKVVSEARLEGLKAQADWANKNRMYLRQRTLVARKYQDMKTQAASLPDGVLNHAKRLPGIQQRFLLDFSHALLRIYTAFKGLSEVYGYNTPIPVPSEAEGKNYFDEIVLWLRSTIQWLIAFSTRDQSVVIPISVREMVGEDNWFASGPSGEWEFNLPTDFFSDMAHIRLRGLSIVVVPRIDLEQYSNVASSSKLYKFTVTPPPRGESLHLSGESNIVDHSLVPPCLLSRVQSRDSRREPDIVGVSSLHNVCPVGTWKVQLLGGIPSRNQCLEPFAELDDIHVDLHLTYRRIF